MRYEPCRVATRRLWVRCRRSRKRRVRQRWTRWRGFAAARRRCSTSPRVPPPPRNCRWYFPNTDDCRHPSSRHCPPCHSTDPAGPCRPSRRCVLVTWTSPRRTRQPGRLRSTRDDRVTPPEPDDYRISHVRSSSFSFSSKFLFPASLAYRVITYISVHKTCRLCSQCLVLIYVFRRCSKLAFKHMRQILQVIEYRVAAADHWHTSGQ